MLDGAGSADHLETRHGDRPTIVGAEHAQGRARRKLGRAVESQLPLLSTGQPEGVEDLAPVAQVEDMDGEIADDRARFLARFGKTRSFAAGEQQEHG